MINIVVESGCFTGADGLENISRRQMAHQAHHKNNCQWIAALIRAMGYEPAHRAITARVKLLYLVRMIPLVEANYHMIELGPRQTGKSFCFTELSPYGTLLAGGAVTVPKLFVTTAGRSAPGLIRSQDAIGFDEIAGGTFNKDDDKNLYKN